VVCPSGLRCCWTRAFMQDLWLFKRRIMCPGCRCFHPRRQTHQRPHSGAKKYLQGRWMCAICVCKHHATLLDNVFKWFWSPASPSTHCTHSTLSTHFRPPPSNPSLAYFIYIFHSSSAWHILLLPLLLLAVGHFKKNALEYNAVKLNGQVVVRRSF